MKLRMYRTEDTKSLVDLFTASVHGLADKHYDAGQLDAWAPRPGNLETWQARLAKLRTLVAEEGGAYLGFISYEPDGHIDLLYTAPDVARRGVATALLANAADRLVADGAVSELYTEASLVAAPFFTRHGFEITEERFVERRGQVLKQFAMRRRIR